MTSTSRLLSSSSPSRRLETWISDVVTPPRVHPTDRAMPVRIRLARFGTKNRPHYRVYVADSRAADGKHIEIVGHYDPIAQKDGHKHVGLNDERIKYWLSVGAQPSDTVARLLGQAGVIPALPRRGRSAVDGRGSRRRGRRRRDEDFLGERR